MSHIVRFFIIIRPFFPDYMDNTAYVREAVRFDIRMNKSVAAVDALGVDCSAG